MTYFSCTESEAGPVIDFIWAGLNLLGALAVSSAPDDYDSPDATIAGGIAWAGFSTAAGVVGLNKTKKCKDAKRLLAERQAGSRAPLGQQPTPMPAPAETTTPAAPSATAAGSVSLTRSVVAAVVVEPFVDTVAVGQRVQLVATTHGSSGAVVVNNGFVWTSSDDAVASVSGAGLVTAHSEGTVIVSANSESVVGTASVTVLKR